MKTLERCQWPHSSVFIVNHEHTSSFALIVEFERESVCWVHIEISYFWRQDRVYYNSIFSVNKL